MSSVIAESQNVAHDVDAAHARLRAHQSNLDYVNSRIEANDRRIDRLERRVDDQSQVLADTKAATVAIQDQLKGQTVMLERAASREAEIISQLNTHIRREIDQEKTRTEQIERLHRVLIRATTIFAVLAIALVALTEKGGLLELIVKAFGG